ncbi:MAG: SPASM domain-containing protein [Candidatus Aminicenantes bacterium]|nr:MAG: SPASM domain-containing protein [Candidatus Aminicenantes bacterium]
MCFQSDFSREMPRYYYMEKLIPVYPYLKLVIFQGGEPTIVPEVKELMEFLNTRYPRIKLGIMTNGYFFDDFWINKFVKYGKFVSFSINAASKETYNSIVQNGNWEKVNLNIKKFVDIKTRDNSNVSVWASFVVLNDNIHELSKFILFCNGLGVNKIRFFYSGRLLPKNRSIIEDELRKARILEKELTDIEIDGLDFFEFREFNKRFFSNCPFPFNEISIEVNGRVSFCCHFGETIGNLNFNSIEKIWNSLVAKKYRALFKKRDYRYCSGYCDPYYNKKNGIFYGQ